MKYAPAFLLWVIIGLIPILVPSSAFAAALYIDPAMSELHRGDSVTMAVRLDVDEAAGECINAVDGVINYSTNIEPVDISIGDSILRVWVEEPKIDKVNRTITFAGGIPNGYCGRVAGDPRLTNVLTEIVFQSPGFTVGGNSDPVATIDFSDESTAYLNDGLGTKVALATYPAKITLDSKAGTSIVNPWQEEVRADNIPPEEFSIEGPHRSEREYSQKYYITFSTTDKQTGIDHYEVMEEPLTQLGSFQWGRADAPWIEVQDNLPVYVLKDQSLNSIIRVKAVDKAGNERIDELVPDETMRTLSHAQVLTIIAGFAVGVLLVVVGVVVTVWLRKRRRSSAQRSSTSQAEVIEE